MNELRVLFDPADDGYAARLTDGDANPLGVEAPFAPFLSEEEYEDLRWYLEEYMDLPDGGAVVRARGVERDADAWGRRLHDDIFGAEENRKLLDQLLDAPEPRVLTIATRDSALLRLPWELMADDAGSLAQRLSIRRQLDEPEKEAPREIQLPLRILYVVSRPTDTGFIDPRLTTKSLFAALDPLGDAVRVDFCRPPTLARMEEVLRDAQAAGDPYDLVHFDGHGTFMPDAQVGALCFENPDDGSGKAETDLVRADRLGDLLARYDVPLVVLEACRSATLGRSAVFRSVAPRLIEAGVGSVLSMGHAVHVEAARLLLDRFYRELVRGTTIGHAVAEGRSALRTVDVRWIEAGPLGRTIRLKDWFLPHLYQRGADEPLLPRNAAARRPVRQFDVFLSHPGEDSARVVALATLLSDKHGLRVWLDKWEGGPGKLEPQLERGIRDSRFTVVVGSRATLGSRWVTWEIEKHRELNPDEDRLIPILLEDVELPTDLEEFRWIEFTDPAADEANAAELAADIRSKDAEDARRRRDFRPPPEHGQPGAFPRPPRYGFHGRARELHELERRFRHARGIVLHAMGGMGKTTLATEAAHWWTRSGLFRDGACFLSFEQFTSADRVVQVFGEYCEGPKFNQRPASEQHRRALEFFRDREVLMVWDNYESALPQFNQGDAHASPYTDDERTLLAKLFDDLMSGEGKGRLLVTSRPGETGLPGAQRMELEGLARPDSLWLLQRILERDRLSLDDPRFAREKLDPLLDDLADHPLSLELVGPHLRTMTPEAIRADFGKLLSKFRQDAPEERNTSLLASLEFSRRHLSPAAREALPWLGLFSGGVFETLLLDISQIAPEAWEPIRMELEAIALLRVEDGIRISDRPFLRFHPTLAIASTDQSVADDPQTRRRFLEVYLNLKTMLDDGLRGPHGRTALLIMNREEANYRTAVHWAVTTQRLPTAAGLGNTFRTYLERSNRLRELDAWVQWLRDAVSGEQLTSEGATYERQHAWALLSQGKYREAVGQLEALIDRLRRTTEFNPVFQLAAASSTLGRVWLAAGHSNRALPILRDAVKQWELLVESVGGMGWNVLLKAPDFEEASAELGNLAATMGDLANALSMEGRHTEALEISETSLEIRQRLGDHREAAAAQGQCATILRAMGRFEEADKRYDMVLESARQAGDRGLEGIALQNQGNLARSRNQLSRATLLYKQALQRFQEAGDEGAIMRTFNCMGVVEYNTGRLAEARAWYERSRELAVRLGDQVGIGQAAQNIGILYQEEGVAARDRGDEQSAERHFQHALLSLHESLRVKQGYGNKPDEASAWSQLARLLLLVDDLGAAEHHAHEARKIREELDLLDVWKDYTTLYEIAQARDDGAATEWAMKRDEVLKEVQRRAGGGADIPAPLANILQTLTLACAQAGFADADLHPATENGLAQLERAPAPFPDFVAALRQLAAGELPSIPSSLPPELRQLLEDVIQAIEDAQNG